MHKMVLMVEQVYDNPASDHFFMREALKEAVKAAGDDEVPVGCVIIHGARIIARGYNRTESLQDPTAHAEMLAITSAAEHLGTWRLNGATVYCTLEPCAMCAGALVLARVDRLVFGAPDPKFGACGSIFNVVADYRTNHRMAVSTGILKEESISVMKDFFAGKRGNRDER